MSRLRFAGVATLLGAVVLGALIYRAYAPSSSPRDAASDRGSSRKGGSAGRVVPVIVAKAVSEDFKIRRRTIGILESPAIVVVKSRIDSQVLEQHVRDGQLVKQGRSAVHPRRSRDPGADRARRGAARQGPGQRSTAAAGRPGALPGADRQERRAAPAARSGDRRLQGRAQRRSRPTRRSCGPTACSSDTPRSRRRSPAASAPSA